MGKPQREEWELFLDVFYEAVELETERSFPHEIVSDPPGAWEALNNRADAPAINLLRFLSDADAELQQPHAGNAEALKERAAITARLERHVSYQSAGVTYFWGWPAAEWKAIKSKRLEYLEVLRDARDWCLSFGGVAVLDSDTVATTLDEAIQTVLTLMHWETVGYMPRPPSSWDVTHFEAEALIAKEGLIRNAQDAGERVRALALTVLGTANDSPQPPNDRKRLHELATTTSPLSYKILAHLWDGKPVPFATFHKVVWSARPCQPEAAHKQIDRLNTKLCLLNHLDMRIDDANAMVRLIRDPDK